jgi:hypothetical protein
MRKGAKIDEDIGFPAEIRMWNLLNSSEERYDVTHAVGNILFFFGLDLLVVGSL